MSSESTLDDLWKSLGLDSLPPDTGAANTLDQTRVRDWEESTIRSGEHPAGAAQREDLPRLSLTPPMTSDAPVAERELVVTGLLGEGGMGKVLLAHQSSLGRDVAVKVPTSEGAVRALLHEAMTGGGLEHPAIIPVYSLGTDGNGRPALVMKRVDGVSWSMLLRNQADPAWERLIAAGDDRLDTHVDILRQVSNAIAYAHRRGVLHRDIKPSNVLIGEFGEVYLADWGIAIRKTERDMGRRPSLVGSPVYLAPEMATGDDAKMDERTDVFLLGATLYELLSGAPPWWAPDLKACVEVALECKPKPLPATAPKELVDICLKAMRKEPAHRFATALEFRDALSGYLRHRGSVHLAQATQERLMTLLATLQSTAPDRVYPLLSECRFGFQQALREWPENDVARAGLTKCLEATAMFELKQGHLDAARALVSELPSVPTELAIELTSAERTAQIRAEERKKLENLRRQLDVRVAARERAWMFGLTIIAVLVLTTFPFFAPELHRRLNDSRWYLSGLMGVMLTFLSVATFFGRRSLLSTALNRRIVGLLSLSAVGVFFQRVFGAVLGTEVKEVVLQNGVLLTTVCIAGGITLHNGFYAAAASALAGIVAVFFLNDHHAQAFGISSVGCLLLVILSWREKARETQPPAE